MKYVELVDVHGVQRLLPLDKLDIHSVNSDISNDGTYWVKGTVGNKGNTSEVYIHVKGPVEAILSALGGVTVEVERVQKLESELIRYKERLREVESLSALEAELKELRSAYSKLDKININLGQWNYTNIQKYSCPSFWSMYKLKKGYQQYATNRLFATPIGSTGQGYGQGLNKSHTNIKERGRFGYMGENAKLDIWGVKVELFGSPEDVQLAKKVGTVSFDFTQTTIDIGNLGSFDWAESNTGYYKFGEPKEPNFKSLSPVSNLFTYGRDVVTVKPSMEVGILFNLNDEPTLKDDLEVRITLFGNYSVNVEVG